MPTEGGIRFGGHPLCDPVQGFSRAARRRLLDLLATIIQECVPAFVTLTFPDEFPACREDYKNFLDLLGQRVLRRWRKASIIRKLEFVERKSGVNKGRLAPHYHLFLFGVPWRFPFQEVRGRHYRLEHTPLPDAKADRWLEWIAGPTSETIEKQNLVSWGESDDVGFPDEPGTLGSLRHWMSRVWFDVVGSRDPRHYRAGTGVEPLRSIQGAFWYVAKSYFGKPVDLATLPVQPGRFWGVIGRRNLPRAPRDQWRMSLRQTFQLLLMVRRHRRAQASRKRQVRSANQTGGKLYCCVGALLPQVMRSLGLRDDEIETVSETPGIFCRVTELGSLQAVSQAFCGQVDSPPGLVPCKGTGGPACCLQINERAGLRGSLQPDSFSVRD